NSTSTTEGGGDSNDIKSSYEIDEEDKVFRSDSTEIDRFAFKLSESTKNDHVWEKEPQNNVWFTVSKMYLYACLEPDMFESMVQFVDGLKFTCGSQSLMPKSFIREATKLAHEHDIYVRTGDWAKYLQQQGYSSYKEYIEECKQVGFDTVKLNISLLELPEDTLLRYIRLIKSKGLKAKPQFAVKFNQADIPTTHEQASAGFVFLTTRASGDIDVLIRRAERCLKARADMISIDAEGVWRFAEFVRLDIIAKVIGHLGLEKTMFEGSNSKTSEWLLEVSTSASKNLHQNQLLFPIMVEEVEVKVEVGPLTFFEHLVVFGDGVLVEPAVVLVDPSSTSTGRTVLAVESVFEDGGIKEGKGTFPSLAGEDGSEDQEAPPSVNRLLLSETLTKFPGVCTLLSTLDDFTIGSSLDTVLSLVDFRGTCVKW
nr:protein heat-stress-associated 32 [Tanacetum cinerariifolium]